MYQQPAYNRQQPAYAGSYQQPQNLGVGFSAGATTYDGRDSMSSAGGRDSEIRTGLAKEKSDACCSCLPLFSSAEEDTKTSFLDNPQGHGSGSGAFSRPGRSSFAPPPPPRDKAPAPINPPSPSPQLEGAPQGWDTRARRRRTTVTSESLQAEDAARYKAPFYAKAPQDVERIMQAISKNVLFAHLREEQRSVVVGAMFEVRKPAGEVVIRQGDEGDYFYIVDRGLCDVYVSTDGAEPRHVLECGPGRSFGELALMYNAPRAATVVARGESRLWALDRMTFKLILMQSTVQQRSLLSGFVERVPLLENLSHAERLQVVDALEEREVNAGDVVVRQGEQGDEFFIIEKGEFVCLQSPDAHSRPVEVGRLKAGDYFGEIALLHDRPRAATVQAVAKGRILAMQRDTFTRLMGPLNDYLNRRVGAYQSAKQRSDEGGVVNIFRRMFN